MKKKVLAMVLATVMTAGVLAGCCRGRGCRNRGDN